MKLDTIRVFGFFLKTKKEKLAFVDLPIYPNLKTSKRNHIHNNSKVRSFSHFSNPPFSHPNSLG
jgi:hypothetical protein